MKLFQALSIAVLLLITNIAYARFTDPCDGKLCTCPATAEAAEQDANWIQGSGPDPVDPANYIFDSVYAKQNGRLGVMCVYVNNTKSSTPIAYRHDFSNPTPVYPKNWANDECSVGPEDCMVSNGNT